MAGEYHRISGQGVGTVGHVHSYRDDKDIHQVVILCTKHEGTLFVVVIVDVLRQDFSMQPWLSRNSVDRAGPKFRDLAASAS